VIYIPLGKENSDIKVIGIVGSLAAGKDELVNYLKTQYKIPAIQVGELAREYSTGRETPPLTYDVSAKRLAQHGPAHFIRHVIETLEENNNNDWETGTVVLAGLTSPAEIRALKEHFGQAFTLVHVQEQAQNEDASQTEPTDATNSWQETVRLADVTLQHDDSHDAFDRQIEMKVVPHLIFAPEQPE